MSLRKESGVLAPAHHPDVTRSMDPIYLVRLGRMRSLGNVEVTLQKGVAANHTVPTHFRVSPFMQVSGSLSHGRVVNFGGSYLDRRLSSVANRERWVFPKGYHLNCSGDRTATIHPTTKKGILRDNHLVLGISKPRAGGMPIGWMGGNPDSRNRVKLQLGANARGCVLFPTGNCREEQAGRITSGSQSICSRTGTGNSLINCGA